MERGGTTVTVDLCAAPVGAPVSQTPDDVPGAVVSIADAHAAALVRRVLESLGTPVLSESNPDRALLWVVDPAAADVNVVKRWVTERPQHRRLVLFGRPPPDPAPAWEALHPETIEDPDDFEGLRATIGRVVTAR